MKVYIIMSGECLEGGSVSGVYTSRESAWTAIEPMINEHVAQHGTEWDLVDIDHWSDGTDFLCIEEHEVLP